MSAKPPPLRIAIAPIGSHEISEAFRRREAAVDSAMSMDRRRHYRVEAHDTTPLAAVVAVDGARYAADLVNASLEGVQVSLPVRTAPRISVGARAVLTFSQVQGGNRIEAESELRFSAVREALVLLGFAFVDPAGVRAQMEAASGPKLGDGAHPLWSVFNRRRAQRVVQDPTELPVIVELTVKGRDGGESIARVVPVDLSLRGIAIAGSGAELAVLLDGDDLVQVTIHVPGAAQGVAVQGTIRNVISEPGQTRIGIEFDRDAGDAGRSDLAMWIQTRLEALKRA